MEPLRIFDNFRLEDLPEEWINSVWDGEFLTFENVPQNYIDHINSEDMDILMSDCSTIIKNWITENETELATIENSLQKNKEVTWQTLISLNVNPRSLLTVLGYIIKNGQSIDANEDARQSCLRASNLYLILLSVPGSNAFNVFHQNLYHLTLNTFTLSEKLVDKNFKRSVADMDLAELYEPEAEVMIATEKSTLIKGLNSLMFNVIKMLKGFHLRDQPRSLEITVRSLIRVAKLAREVISFDKNARVNEATITSLSYNAYIALHSLCHSNHGGVDVTVKLIAKCILPSLVSNQDDLKTKELSAVRETMTNFLEKLLNAHREKARIGISTLIQHLFVKCPDRSEQRSKQATVILRLINCCDKEIYNKAIEDLVALAHNNKINLRIFAQEIIHEFLTDDSANGNNRENFNNVIKLLYATVLSRCVDSSNLVRGKAMTTIAECTKSESNFGSKIIKDIYESDNRDKPLPSFQTLREAIFEDIDPLPGSNTVTSILSSTVKDERARTRCNALETLGNLVRVSAGLLNILTPNLGQHCRDPAMTVRCQSVQIFTKLLNDFPEHPTLPQEWVKQVLPQIFDMEVKVQEKVLESLYQLTICNIEFFTNDDVNSAADLPWAILNQITEEKMRKHLTKACAVWVKTERVTDSLIGKIKSHIGTRNDIPAWVLLAAVAKYMNLPEMNKHFGNYKEILSQNTFQANLIVEVMRNSWPNMEISFLKTLQPDLFESLSEFQVNFNLISICCDLFTEVTKHLNPEDGDEILKLNALDLMKISEAKLEKFVDHEDGGRESLQVYLRAMLTLGNASHLCTGSISPSTLCVLQGIVVEWDSLPEAVRYLNELRAAAVTVLGQQAMRDREDAQEILPVLGYLIRISTIPNSRVGSAVKVNACKALADICIRYTALAEPYLPEMCISMKDEDPTIREAIVVLFIQLLLEDFIKVKGPFFFHILTMLTDTDDMVRDLTVFLITERLLAKNKTLIYRQFLESIFHFNNYKFPNKLSSNKLNRREMKALTLTGQRNSTQRKIIYNFMIEHLEPIEKPKIIARLTSEIISAVICRTINVQKEEGLSVLKDCLYILSSDQLQSGLMTKRNDDDCQDENPLTENQPATKVANAIAADIKKHRIEVLIPTLVKLKRMLNKISSPFVEYVVEYYLKIVTEYKREQLASLYSEHPYLEKEIEKDRKKYESKFVASDSDESEQILEERSSSQASLAQIAQDRMPRIVLRRISSLTYPGINIWQSPSQSDGQSAQFLSSRNQISMTSPNRLATLNCSPPRSLPGPSNSTPTTSEPRQLRRSPRCSPIHNYDLFKSPRKRKGIPIISEDEEDEQITQRSLKSLEISRKKKAARKLHPSLAPRNKGSSTEIDGTESESN